MANGLYIAQGIMQGAEKASANLLNLMMAKEKLTQERQRFDIQTKIDKMKLQQLEGMYNPEALEIEKKTQKQAAMLRATMFEKANAEFDTNIKGTSDFINKSQNALMGLSRAGIDVSKYGFNTPSRAEMTQQDEDRDMLGFKNWVLDSEGSKISRDAMDKKYPQDSAGLDAYEKELKAGKVLNEPLKKEPLKRAKKFGFIARLKEGYSAMNDQTKAQVDRIADVGTYQAIFEMFRDRDALEKAGVNIKALEDYYSEEINYLISKGVLKFKGQE